MSEFMHANSAVTIINSTIKDAEFAIIDRHRGLFLVHVPKSLENFDNSFISFEELVGDLCSKADLEAMGVVNLTKT